MPCRMARVEWRVAASWYSRGHEKHLVAPRQLENKSSMPQACEGLWVCSSQLCALRNVRAWTLPRLESMGGEQVVSYYALKKISHVAGLSAAFIGICEKCSYSATIWATRLSWTDFHWETPCSTFTCAWQRRNEDERQYNDNGMRWWNDDKEGMSKGCRWYKDSLTIMGWQWWNDHGGMMSVWRRHDNGSIITTMWWQWYTVAYVFGLAGSWIKQTRC